MRTPPTLEGLHIRRVQHIGDYVVMDKNNTVLADAIPCYSIAQYIVHGLRDVASKGMGTALLSVALLFFWFAAFNHDGQPQFFTYRDLGSCRVVHDAYQRAGVKVTDCLRGREG